MTEHEFEKEKIEEAFENCYDEKHAEFEKLSREKLIISLIGSVNAGKSKTINALTGIRYAEVKARAGWTKEVSLYELRKGVFIADTPGLHDIDEAVSKKASNYVEENSDIILFFLNATVGVTKHEKEAFLQVSQLGKEIVLVLNKIDALEDDEVVDVVEQIEEDLGVEPLAISAKNNTGIYELNSRIIQILEEKGKDLLFLKVSRYKEKEVKKWINGASVSAAGIGAIPIPGSDIIPLTALQVGLAMKIAYIYDIMPSKNDVMKLVGATVTGSVGKQLARWAITALKGAGWIPGAQLLEVAVAGIAASVAASLTYAFGWACNAYYKSGMTMDLGEVSEVFKASYEEYKNRPDNKT
ncbi:MAG: 50S ribosome-binding GTPase [Candidatus Hydrogenedentes bacterium]|nr:50S ribosome-binding GTPase [Candidatus Hydrogenedentota bacterium]